MIPDAGQAFAGLVAAAFALFVLVQFRKGVKDNEARKQALLNERRQRQSLNGQRRKVEPRDSAGI